MVDARWYYIHTLASYVILVCAVLLSRPPSRPFPASGGPRRPPEPPPAALLGPAPRPYYLCIFGGASLYYV